MSRAAAGGPARQAGGRRGTDALALVPAYNEADRVGAMHLTKPHPTATSRPPSPLRGEGFGSYSPSPIRRCS